MRKKYHNLVLCRRVTDYRPKAVARERATTDEEGWCTVDHTSEGDFNSEDDNDDDNWMITPQPKSNRSSSMAHSYSGEKPSKKQRL